MLPGIKKAAWGNLSRGDELTEFLLANTPDVDSLPDEALDLLNASQAKKTYSRAKVATAARLAGGSNSALILDEAAADSRITIMTVLAQNPSLSGAHLDTLCAKITKLRTTQASAEAAHTVLGRNMTGPNLVKLVKKFPRLIEMSRDLSYMGLSKGEETLARLARTDDELLTWLSKTPGGEVIVRRSFDFGYKSSTVVIKRQLARTKLIKDGMAREASDIGVEGCSILIERGVVKTIDDALELARACENPGVLTRGIYDGRCTGRTPETPALKEVFGAEYDSWLRSSIYYAAGRGGDTDLLKAFVEQVVTDRWARGRQVGPFTEEAVAWLAGREKTIKALLGGERGPLTSGLVQQLVTCPDKKLRSAALEAIAEAGGSAETLGADLSYRWVPAKVADAILACLEESREEVSDTLAVAALLYVAGQASKKGAEKSRGVLIDGVVALFENSGNYVSARMSGGWVAALPKLSEQEQARISAAICEKVSSGGKEGAKQAASLLSRGLWSKMTRKETRVNAALAIGRELGLRSWGQVGWDRDAVELAGGSDDPHSVAITLLSGRRGAPKATADYITNLGESFRALGGEGTKKVVGRLLDLTGDCALDKRLLALDMADSWTGSIQDLNNAVREI